MRKITLNLQVFSFILIAIFLVSVLVYKPYYDFQNHVIKLSPFFKAQHLHKAKHVGPIDRLHFDSKCLCRSEFIDVIKSTASHDMYSIDLRDINNRYLIQYNLTKRLFETAMVTCDPFNSLRRGPNQKVISVSLFDYDKSKRKVVLHQLRRLAARVKQLLPNWFIRVYHDNTVSMNSICEMQCLKDETKSAVAYDNIDFCDINHIPFDLTSSSSEQTWSALYMIPSTYRWLPVIDDFVDIMLSRSIDTCLSQREVYAVYDWLSRDQQTAQIFHIMRDHPSHKNEMPSDLWSYDTRKNKSLSTEIFNLLTDRFLADWYMNDGYKDGLDQQLIDDFLWPLINKSTSMVKIHDSYNCNKLVSGGDPFPIRRHLYANQPCHVGSCCNHMYDDHATNTYNISEISKRRMPMRDAQNLKESMCPIECRPSNHLDWIFC